MNNLKIIQINAARSQIVNDELLHYSTINKIDIILIQEPYTRNHKLVGLEINPFRVICHKGQYIKGRESITTWTAIVVLNPKLEIVALQQYMNKHFAIANIGINGTNVVLISAYFQFREPTIRFTTELTNIIEKIGLDKSIIICADVNAFSTMWGSKNTDHRGIFVEDFITRENLKIENQIPHNPTYLGPRGNTWIDITLTNLLTDRIKEWKVIEQQTTSDHNIISFTLHIESNTNANNNTNQRQKRYNVKKAKWDIFTKTLQKETNKNEITGDINNMIKQLTKNLIVSADNSIPKTKRNLKIKPQWWTPELDEKRRYMRKKQRLYIKKCNSNNPEEYRQAYNFARNQYTSQLRKEKFKSWKEFTTEGNKDIWGKTFKWIKKGTITQHVPTSVRKTDGNFTTTVGETLKEITDTLIPTIDGEDSRIVIERTNYTLERNVTKEEVKIALWRMNPNKAPGYDNLTGKILKKAWHQISDDLTLIINESMKNGTFPQPWKNAELVIIPKGSDKDLSLPKSYRPISLLPVMSKIYEHILFIFCTFFFLYVHSFYIIP